MIGSVMHSLLAASLAAMTSLTSVEQGGGLPTIGHAVPVDPVTDVPYQTEPRNGLRQLGYVDGQSFTFVLRYASCVPMPSLKTMLSMPSRLTQSLAQSLR